VISEDLKVIQEFEFLIFHPEEDGFKKAGELYKNKKEILDLNDVFYIVENAALQQPLMFEEYWKFIQDYKINLIDCMLMSDFVCYLYLKGYIEQNMISQFDNPSKLEELDPVKEGTLWYYILNDDLENFDKVRPADLQQMTEKITVGKQQMNVIDFAAFCGSQKILDFLIGKNVAITFETAKFAISGGHKKAIERIQQAGFKVDEKLLPVAIEAHQNDLAEEIIQNYGVGETFLTTPIKSSNTTMFFSLFKYGKANLEETDNDKRTPLLASSYVGNFLLSLWLINNGAVVDSKDKDGNTGLHLACEKGSINIAMMYVENYGLKDKD
jgi:hypothetical protein